MTFEYPEDWRQRAARTRRGPQATFTPEQMLERRQTWIDRLGRPPTSTDWQPNKTHRPEVQALLDDPDEFWPTTGMVNRAFGSWSRFKIAAGDRHPGNRGRPRQPRFRPITEAERLEELREQGWDNEP
jgi:hypothetical protein